MLSKEKIDMLIFAIFIVLQYNVISVFVKNLVQIIRKGFKFFWWWVVPLKSPNLRQCSLLFLSIFSS